MTNGFYIVDIHFVLYIFTLIMITIINITIFFNVNVIYSIAVQQLELFAYASLSKK